MPSLSDAGSGTPSRDGAVDDRTRRPRRRRILSIARGEAGFWRWLGLLAVTYAALQVLFFIAIVAAGSVPNRAVLNALEDGAESGRWSAVDFPSDGVGHTTEDYDFAGVSDSYTQCIALTLGLSADRANDAGPLYRALAWPHLGTCSLAYPAVETLAADGVAGQGFTYNRYWNGSAVLTRPMLAMAGVGGVKLASMALFAIGLVAAFVAAWRRVSPWVGVALLAPVLLSTNILTQSLDSYPHIISFAVILFGVAAGFRWGSAPAPALLIVGAIAGASLNFVDFLLNPPLAWAAFAFAAGASRWANARGKPQELLVAIGAGALGWIAGYGVTWITRWAIAIAVFGDTALEEILGIIGTRLGGANGDLVKPGIGSPTKANVGFWWETIPTSHVIAVVAAVTVLAAVITLLVRRDLRGLLIGVVVASPVLLIPLWYELLSNHSQIHVWFTYRAVPLGLGILVASALLPVVLRARRPTEDRSHETRLDSVAA